MHSSPFPTQIEISSLPQTKIFQDLETQRYPKSNSGKKGEQDFYHSSM